MRRPRTAKEIVFGATGALAGTVYGTIVVMAVIAAGSQGHATEPWRLAGVVVGTVFALWVAHVYAHALSDSVSADRRLTWTELVHLARREASIPLAAVAPVAALALGALDVIPEHSAIRLALGIGVATLAVQGVRYARIEHLGRTPTLVAVALNMTLGLAIVALEVALAH